MQVLNIDFERKDANKSFCQSLRETGFAVLNNHPISHQLIDEVYKGWNDFFSSDKKDQFLFDKIKQDGYFPFLSENAKGNKLKDLKEFFHIYPWGRIPQELSETSLELYKELSALAAILLTWIEEFLPAAILEQLSMPLHKMIIDSPCTLLRVLHYPPIANNIEKNAIRAAPHEDINLITLLPAATTPGLEVKDINDSWHPVPCDPGNIVVNVGDMLQMCTRHYYKSTTHRVINPSSDCNVSRYSMPLFLHARGDVMLSKEYSAKKYLEERLKEIGTLKL